MKNILFLFNFGSEIRQFAYSGILEELLNKNHNVYVSLRVNNEKVLACLDKRIEILPYYKKGVPFYLNMLKTVLDEENGRSQLWSYMTTKTLFKKPIFKVIYFILFNILKVIVKLNIVKYFLTKLETKLLNSLSSEAYKEIFTNKNVTEIVVNVPNYNYHFLATAKSMNIPVSLLFHTNKDLYTLGRLSPFYTKIGVWNKTMKKELLSINKNIDEDCVKVIGCSHFTNFRPILDKIKTPEKIEILYIAAAPFVITNEYVYISLLQSIMVELGITDYLINIKVNPMDATSYWEDFASDKVCIIKSKWIWNKDEAFNYPEKLDLENFSSLLQNATCCVGLPSTVVIEAALIKTPFINICFNHKEVQTIYENISDMWHAPFYSNVLKLGAAVGTFSEDELKMKLDVFIRQDGNLEEEQHAFIESELTYSGIELRDKAISFLGKNYAK